MKTNMNTVCSTNLQDIKLPKIEEFGGHELRVRWEGMSKRISRGNTVRIANTGLVKSGKSSLFNALIDRIGNERFPTGSARTTIREDEESFAQNVKIVDTPGIDATSEDDETAFKSLLSADLFVIVHSLGGNVLTANELVWIKRLSATINNPDELRERVIFVCSKIDGHDGQGQEKQYGEIMSDIKKNLFSALGVEVPVYEVSVHRYKTGKDGNKERMIDRSGIPQLKDALVSRATTYRKKYMSDSLVNDIKKLCDDSKSVLSDQVSSRKSKRDKIKNEIIAASNKKLEEFLSKLRVFNELKSKVKNLQNELSRI